MSAAEALAGAAWFFLYAVAVFAAIRGMPQRSPAMISVATAMLCTAVAFPAAAMSPVAGNFWRSLAVFCFLSICYLMVFGATYKSISLRMLLDLLRAPARQLPAEEVFSRYIEGESFQARTEVMLGQGLATLTADGYVLTPKGERIARSTRALQGVFGIHTSG